MNEIPILNINNLKYCVKLLQFKKRGFQPLSHFVMLNIGVQCIKVKCISVFIT